PEPELETITYRRRKPRGPRADQFEGLPVETIEYRLPEEERVCTRCHGRLHEMSTQVRRELKIIPAQAKVVEPGRYVYGSRTCERQDTSPRIRPAPAPTPPRPRRPAATPA